jgi:hypothetical protein
MPLHREDETGISASGTKIAEIVAPGITALAQFRRLFVTMFATIRSLGVGNNVTSPGPGNLSVENDLTVGGMRKERNQPAFLAFNARSANYAGNVERAINTWHTVDFNSVPIDVGGNFFIDTFTAPVKGLYFLTTQVTVRDIDTDSIGYRIALVTSERRYIAYIDPRLYRERWDVGWHAIHPITSVCDMNAGDTAYVQIYQNAGDQQVDIVGHASTALTYFSGYLLG